MKKVYDWDIRIGIRAVDYKKTLHFVLSNHTTAHQIALKVAKELGYDQFSSTMELYVPTQLHPIRPQQTLYQHNIKDGQLLNIKMAHTIASKPKTKYYTKQAKLFGKFQQQDIMDFQKYDPKISMPAYGLVVQGMCANSKCVNYAKDVQVPLGTGKFNFFQLNSTLKCPVCPYRDQKINPPLVIKGIKIVNSYFRCEGRHRDKTNFIADKSFPLWTKVSGEQCKSLYKYIQQYKWVQLYIYVKQL